MCLLLGVMPGEGWAIVCYCSKQKSGKPYIPPTITIEKSHPPGLPREKLFYCNQRDSVSVLCFFVSTLYRGYSLVIANSRLATDAVELVLIGRVAISPSPRSKSEF